MHNKQLSSSEESCSSGHKSICSYSTTITQDSSANNNPSNETYQRDSLKNRLSQYQPTNTSPLRFTKLTFESNECEQIPIKPTTTTTATTTKTKTTDDGFNFEEANLTPIKATTIKHKSVNGVARNNSVYEASEHESSFSFDNTVDLQVNKIFPNAATMERLKPSADIISAYSPVKPLNLPIKQTALRISYSTKEFNHNKFIGAGANLSEESFSPLDNDKEIEEIPKVISQHLDLIRDTRNLINNNTFNKITDSRESSPEKYSAIMQPIIEEMPQNVQRRTSTNPFEAKVLQMKKSQSNLYSSTSEMNQKGEKDKNQDFLTVKPLSLPKQLKKKLSFIDLNPRESIENIRAVVSNSANNVDPRKSSFVVLGVSSHDTISNNSLPAILGASENANTLKRQKTGDIIVVNSFGNEVDDIPDYNPFRKNNFNSVAPVTNMAAINTTTAINPDVPARSPFRPILEKFDTPITNIYSRMDLDVTPKSKNMLSPRLENSNAMFIPVAVDSPVGYKQIEPLKSTAAQNNVSKPALIITNETIQENTKRIINSTNSNLKSVETVSVSALRHTNSIQEQYRDLVDIVSPYSRTSIYDITEITKKYLSAPTSPELQDLQQSCIDALCSTSIKKNEPIYDEEYNESARNKSFRSSSSNYSKSVYTVTPEKCVTVSPKLNNKNFPPNITDSPKSIQSLTSASTISVISDEDGLPQTELISEQDLYLIEQSITDDYQSRKKEARKSKLQEFGFNDTEDKSNHRMSYSLLYGAAIKDTQTTVKRLSDKKKSRIISQDYSVLLKNGDKPFKRIVSQKYTYLKGKKSAKLAFVEEHTESPVSDSPRLRALQFESNDFCSPTCSSPATNLKHLRFQNSSIKV